VIRILALDVSLKNIGWAHRCVFGDMNDTDPLTIQDSGTVVGTLKKDEPVYKRIAEIAYYLERAIDAVVRGSKFNYIVVERSFIAGSGDVSRQLAGVQAVVQHILYMSYIDFILLKPSPPT